LKTEGLKATEAECAAGRTAPRVSLDDIEANIAEVHYILGEAIANASNYSDWNHEGDLNETLGVLTVCLVVLRNGFTIIGKAAPASPANFDPKLGRKLAYEDAVRQIWPLMGYELRERLHRASSQPPISIAASDPEMRLHEGTKRLYAKPMTRGDYNAFRGWQQPADEDPEEAGYLVEYTDGGKPNVDGFGGYVSWSPADVFERSYRELPF
jgi:hypothetical protein